MLVHKVYMLMKSIGDVNECIHGTVLSLTSQVIHAHALHSFNHKSIKFSYGSFNIASVLVSGTDIFFIEKGCKIVEQWQVYTSSPVQFLIVNVFVLLL